MDLDDFARSHLAAWVDRAVADEGSDEHKAAVEMIAAFLGAVPKEDGDRLLEMGWPSIHREARATNEAA